MTHAPTQHPDPETLAAFAEGGMNPADAASVVAHLDLCDACTRDVALGMQAAEEEEEDVQDTTPPNVVRPRRWLPWVAAAAAAVLAAGGITWAVMAGGEEEPRTATAGSVRMTVVPAERNEGTALDVTVDGLHRGDYCALVVTNDEGDTWEGGEWTVQGGRVQYDLWTGMDRNTVQDVVLLGSSGEVLRVDVTE